jgi:type II secretory pathway component PulF
MPHFAYEARTEDGQLTSGMVVADDMEQAGLKLGQMGRFVVKLGLADPGDDAGSGAQAAGGRRGSRLRAKRRTVMWFLNQLAVMIDTGITIGESLDCLARQASEPAMKQIVTAVSAAVHEGRPLSDAMEAHPRTFTPAVTALIRASESSGTLASTLTRVASYAMKDAQILRRLRGALVYPAFMFVMCLSVTAFLLTVILPRFVSIYASRGALLPWPTRVLMGTSDLIIGHGLWLLAGTILATVGVVWGLRTTTGRAAADRVQLSLPLFGEVLNKMFQSRAFRALATLIEAGVPLADALRLIRSMSSNICYARLWSDVERSVTNGEHIATAMRGFAFFPESVTQMIDSGDRAGRLGLVCHRLAEFIEEEYDQAIKTVAQMVEPLMILVMGSIIGFVAIALLLPVFKASTLVGR